MWYDGVLMSGLVTKTKLTFRVELEEQGGRYRRLGSTGGGLPSRSGRVSPVWVIKTTMRYAHLEKATVLKKARDVIQRLSRG